MFIRERKKQRLTGEDYVSLWEGKICYLFMGVDVIFGVGS